MYVNLDQLSSWENNGYVFLPALLSREELLAAQKELALIYPSGEDFYRDRDPVRNSRYRSSGNFRDLGFYTSQGELSQCREQFLGLVDFPWTGRALDRLVVHPNLLGAAREFLGVDEIQIYQAQLWAKYTGAANYAQPLHLDYCTHSLLTPDPDAPMQQIEMFLYLHDVTEELAPTHVVSRNLTKDIPVSPHRVWPDERSDLYEEAVSFPGVAGSVLAYAPDVWHRGVDLTQVGGSRVWMNISYKCVDCDWLGLQSFVRAGLSVQWSEFVGSCTPDELAVFGFPKPGHPVYTKKVLEGMSLRYPKLNLQPWFSALKNS
ncbi:MAG: phytanoyl-CoA dioxygenase family protein [Corynebacterium sp.]|nr:phytanoyl-CoA dioxygenase family protein [Corynebacterium sp.]